MEGGLLLRGSLVLMGSKRASERTELKHYYANIGSREVGRWMDVNKIRY